MKKRYIKPDILFDSFSMSASIAANCEVKTNTPTSGICGYEMGDYVVFLSGVSGCYTAIEDGKTFDGLCYHNPSEFYNLFNS